MLILQTVLTCKIYSFSYHNALILWRISFTPIMPVEGTVAEMSGRYVVVVSETPSELGIVIGGNLSLANHSIMLLACPRLLVLAGLTPL